MHRALTHDSPMQSNDPLSPLLGETRRLAVVFITFVIVPILLLLTLGVLALVQGDEPRDYVFGGAILSLVAMTLGGLGVATASVLRHVNYSKIQTDWVSRLSHELRTPLSSIRLFVETLQLGRVAEPSMRQHCLATLSRECARLSTLVDQTLAWARLSAGKRTHCPELCRAADIVDEALAAFELQRMVEHVNVQREIPDGNVGVFADRTAIVGALLNLLQNACRHSGADKHITVGCGAGPRAGSTLLFVNDNGPGIAKREHRRIFEKFYRSKDSRERRLAGTGLGLAITRQIVQDNGGSISVESELGLGSSFRIVLPARARE